MVWIYRGFNFRDLYEVFCIRHNYIWITLTLIAGVAANVLRSLRWQMLLESADIRIKKRRAIELVFISYLINSVTPRLGELTRSLLVRRGDAEVSTRAFGTVIIEKLVDVACLIVVVVIAVAFRWDDTLELVHRFIDGMRQAVPSYTLYIIVGLLICIAIGFTLPRLKQIRTLLLNFWQGITAIARLKSPKSFIGFCTGIGRHWTNGCIPHIRHGRHRFVAPHPGRCRTLALCRSENPHHRPCCACHHSQILCTCYAWLENRPCDAAGHFGIHHLLLGSGHTLAPKPFAGRHVS